MSQRKPNQYKKDIGGTPTKIANYSPSRNAVQRSPLTASKYNISSNSKPTVSYGELQIVLENIQEIRRKANLQINELTSENTKLKEDLMRSQQEYEQLSNRLGKSSYSKNQFESKILEQLQILEGQKKSLQVEIKEKGLVQMSLQAKINDLQRNIGSLEVKNEEWQSKVEEWNSKWKWAFNILAGSYDKSEELIWKVKSQYSEGLWELFQSNSTLYQQLQLKSSKLEIIEGQLREFKGGSKQTTNLLEKSLAQVSNLNLKLTQSEDYIKQLREKCLQSQQGAHELKLKLTESENEVKALQSKVILTLKQRQIDFRDMIEKIARLEEQIVQKDVQFGQKVKRQEYQALISQICEESQDYSQLLQRVRYLQKFKAEHYFNVQKIQFLCKMLDY